MNNWKRAVFLVLEPDVLIASDLRETLLDLDPRSAVLVARCEREARAILDRPQALAAGFLRLPSRNPGRGDLAGAVERRGGRVVVLDGPAVGDAPGWLYTGRPYGADAIADALGRMGFRLGRAVRA